MKTLGDLVRTRRLARGIRLRALARLLNVSHSCLSEIESGRKTASDRLLGLLKDELGLDLPALVEARGRITDDARRWLAGSPATAALVNLIAGQGLTESQITTIARAIGKGNRGKL